MKHRMGGVALAVLGWLGCGGGGDVALEELGAEMGRAVCPKIFECCSDAEVAEQFEGFNPPVESVEGCQDFYSGVVSVFLVPQIRASVEAGRIAYHPDLAGDCLARIEEMSCAEYAASQAVDDFVPGCGQPIEPLVELGGACTNDDECKSGLCTGTSGFPGEEGEEGTCVELPALGEPCDFDCETGFCDFDQEAGESVCQAPFGDGTECFYDEQCESRSCTGGDSSQGTPGTCGGELTCSGR